MKVDEWTSEDGHISGGGEYPPCAGLTSNALPEAQSTVSAESSQTGVSTRNAHIASKPKAQKEEDSPHWYALRTTYGREKKAYDYMTAKGITAFYPTTDTVKLIKGKRKIVTESRLPNIFFAYGTEEQLKSFVYRLISVDPLVELYRNISPYAYVANNPIVYTDPDGRKIDPESQKEWNDQKHHIVDKRDKLQAQINKLNTEAIKKGWNAEKLAKKIGNKQERVSGLNTVISNLAVLEESAQTYSLNSGATNNKLSYDATTGNIVISYSGTALFAHEATHAGQFEIGDIAFASNGSSLAQDVYDEVASYKAQWAYNPSSVGGLSSTNQITASWVQGIKDPTSGDQPYKPGGSANTGISPVNVNSTRDELIRAYPHQESTLRQYPANSTLKSMIPTMYTKHSK